MNENDRAEVLEGSEGEHTISAWSSSPAGASACDTVSVTPVQNPFCNSRHIRVPTNMATKNECTKQRMIFILQNYISFKYEHVYKAILYRAIKIAIAYRIIAER